MSREPIRPGDPLKIASAAPLAGALVPGLMGPVRSNPAGPKEL